MHSLPDAKRRVCRQPVHGGITSVRGLAGGVDWLDFSVSVNPFGPKKSVIEAVAHAPIDVYPDSEATALKESCARCFNYPEEHIFVTAGSTEALWLLSSIYLSKGDHVIAIGPTYGDYQVASEFYGASVTVLQQPWLEGACKHSVADVFKTSFSSGFVSDDFLLAAAERIPVLRPVFVFLCNPNNPTGDYVSRDAVLSLATSCDEAGSILIVDEAYRNFVDKPYDLAEEVLHHNLILLRSMTKDFALASVRVGYLLGAEPIIRSLSESAMPWRISSQAIAAGCAAVDSRALYAADWNELHRITRKLSCDLEEVGCMVYPSAVNFLLLYFPEADLSARLRKEGILVRDCTSFGLNGMLRIGTRLPQDNERLIDAMRKLT